MRARNPARLIAASVVRRSAHLPARCASTSAASSSTSSPPSTSFSWQPALPRGKLAAYDEALDFLAAHRDQCLAEYERLRSLPHPSREQLVEADAWEVDAYVNDPAVRALFRQTNGNGHMERPVMRHLAERKWKKHGGLDLIMGRIYQNKVVPDVLPDLAPTNPLTLSTSQDVIEPGLTIDAKLLESPPTLHYQSFQHPAYPSKSDPHPTALYTLVALDPDTPNPSRHGFTQRLHYLKTNIPLSVVSGQTGLIQEASGNELVGWEPIAPAQGTLKHRLVWVLLRQPSPQHRSEDSSDIAQLSETLPRENFNLRSLMATFGFNLDAIVGVNLVRAEWTIESKEYIDRIWRDFRGVSEAPVFKVVPHTEQYSYPASNVQRRAADLREKAWQRSMEEYEESQAAMGALGGRDDESSSVRQLSDARADQRGAEREDYLDAVESEEGLAEILEEIPMKK